MRLIDTRAKLSRALVPLLALDEPPLRWIAGADAVAGSLKVPTEEPSTLLV